MSASSVGRLGCRFHNLKFNDSGSLSCLQSALVILGIALITELIYDNLCIFVPFMALSFIKKKKKIINKIKYSDATFLGKLRQGISHKLHVLHLFIYRFDPQKYAQNNCSRCETSL